MCANTSNTPDFRNTEPELPDISELLPKDVETFDARARTNMLHCPDPKILYTWIADYQKFMLQRAAGNFRTNPPDINQLQQWNTNFFRWWKLHESVITRERMVVKAEQAEQKKANPPPEEKQSYANRTYRNGKPGR